MEQSPSSGGIETLSTDYRSGVQGDSVNESAANRSE
jgi:hypothetical protein